MKRRVLTYDGRPCIQCIYLGTITQYEQLAVLQGFNTPPGRERPLEAFYSRMYLNLLIEILETARKNYDLIVRGRRAGGIYAILAPFRR